MRDASTISELRAALRRQGVWGARAHRLLQDWVEHVREDAAQRVEQGSAPDVAREAAWKTLGQPEELARTAGRELARASWFGRHPWLAGLVLPVFGWFAVVALVLLVPAWIASQVLENISDLERSHLATLLTALACWRFALNWLPWIFSLAWLVRIAVRMPGGWKLYWITTAALAVFSTGLWMTVTPPLHGPNSGSINISAAGFLGMFVSAVANGLGYHGLGPWPPPITPLAQWIQTAMLLLGAIGFHFTARLRPGMGDASSPTAD